MILLWALLSLLGSAYGTITLTTPATALTINGTFLLVWTFAATDPTQFQLQITGDSAATSSVKLQMTPFMNTKDGNATVPLPNVPAGQYTFQAINPTNNAQVYSTTADFNMQVQAATTTSSSTTSSSTTATGTTSSSTGTTSSGTTSSVSTSKAGSTIAGTFTSASISQTQSQTSTPQPSQNIAGPVAGGVVGGLAFIALVILALFCYRKRRIHKVKIGAAPPSSNGFLDDDAHTPSMRTPYQGMPSSLNTSVPPSPSMRTPYQAMPSSVNASAPVLSSEASTFSSNPQLTPDQNEFVHDLYRRNIPTSVIAGIINRFLQGDSSAGSEFGWSETSSRGVGGSTRQLVPNRRGEKGMSDGAPPRYDQIA